MRASTLFGLTIAILIGMAVVFGVKSAGLFSATPPKATPQELPKILAWSTNHYENLTTTQADVMVRNVDPSEMEAYQRNRHKYMIAMVQAADRRILARNVVVGEPVLKEHFQDHQFPGKFSLVLGPGKRAVNLQMPKDRAGGGIIQKDDHVDVLLTTTYTSDGNFAHARTITVPIALGLRVLVKRDSWFTVLGANDESKPIPFTLEANAYRAALIEFAKEKGNITLVPTGASVNDKKWGNAVTFDSKDEERRSNEVLEGKPITEVDFIEILRLPKIEGLPGMARPIIVERMTSVGFNRPLYFAANGQEIPAGAALGQPAAGYSFKAPAAPTTATPGCATCGKSASRQ